MIPRLYKSTETEFTSFGICPLSEAVSCIVTEERNGKYTLDMEYPKSGLFFNEIKVDRIILAQAHEDDEHAQPFRIEGIEGDMNELIEIHAVHISYQLNWILAGRQTIASGDAQTNMRRTLLLSTGNPFTFYSDISTAHAMTIDEPLSFRSLLGGVEGSYLDTYGGEFEWDRYDVHLWSARGKDNGVRITYGKNLTGLEWETDVSESYDAVYAYWMKEEDNVVTYVGGSIQSTQTDFAFQRLIAIDASSDFQNEPTSYQLDAYAVSYLRSNASDPTVSVRIELVPLWQTEEYKDYAVFEKVGLCDTVHILYEPLNLDLTAKVVKTEYNVLLDRYDSIEISTVKQSLADTIYAMEEQIRILSASGSSRGRLRRL